MKRPKIEKILLPILMLPLLFAAPAAQAASGTMSITPYTGSYTVGTPFSVDLVIDGKGEAFNAAEAKVAVSSALQINNVILGDCDFSFITTPTTTDPSFVGAILGNSSQRCTVYTLEVTPTSLGSATITLANASIKKYGNAEEILQSIQNGTYTFTGSTGYSSQQTTTTTQSSNQSASQSVNQTANTAPASDPGLVTVVLNVVDSNNNPIAGATVLLNSSGPTPVLTNSSSNAPAAQKKASTQSNPGFQAQAITDASGKVQITNVPPGVHTIEVKDQEKPIANNIVNVSGNDSVMTLGIKAQKESMDLLRSSIIIVTILIIVGFVVIYFRNFIFQLFQRK